MPIYMTLEDVDKLTGGTLDPSVKYNGSFDETEDEFDYVRINVMKGVRIG